MSFYKASFLLFAVAIATSVTLQPKDHKEWFFVDVAKTKRARLNRDRVGESRKRLGEMKVSGS